MVTAIPDWCNTLKDKCLQRLQMQQVLLLYSHFLPLLGNNADESIYASFDMVLR